MKVWLKNYPMIQYTEIFTVEVEKCVVKSFLPSSDFSKLIDFYIYSDTAKEFKLPKFEQQPACEYIQYYQQFSRSDGGYPAQDPDSPAPSWSSFDTNKLTERTKLEFKSSDPEDAAAAGYNLKIKVTLRDANPRSKPHDVNQAVRFDVKAIDPCTADNVPEANKPKGNVCSTGGFKKPYFVSLP